MNAVQILFEIKASSASSLPCVVQQKLVMGSATCMSCEGLSVLA